MLSGCQPQQQQITISATYKRQPLHCDSFFDMQGQAWRIDTLRFFISDLAFKVSGQWHNAQLLSDEWQTGEVSLLSLITPDCLSEQVNTQLRFYSDVPWQDAQAVRFVVAVPFDAALRLRVEVDLRAVPLVMVGLVVGACCEALCDSTASPQARQVHSLSKRV